MIKVPFRFHARIQYPTLVAGVTDPGYKAFPATRVDETISE